MVLVLVTCLFPWGNQNSSCNLTYPNLRSQLVGKNVNSRFSKCSYTILPKILKKICHVAASERAYFVLIQCSFFSHSSDDHNCQVQELSHPNVPFTWLNVVVLTLP